MANVLTSDIITLIRGLIKDLEQSDGRCGFTYSTDTSFKLDKINVDSTSIIVYKNGTALSSSDWTYNSDTNEVTITSSLTSGDDILITFDYYESYSDSEIISYIKSNLIQFTIHRYKKTFYINSDNEVVTLNGTNPTEEEGNIIAAITAIDIDPQNIKISTRDFTIEAVESKSKSDLIKDVFLKFQRGFGHPEFIQDDQD